MILGVGVLALGASGPASAAPVYELDGQWEPGTPGQPGVPDPFAGKGDVVTAVWRLNVNSDLPAPTNELVDNVHATVTLENGHFTQLPSVCLTGGAFTPQSSLSADKRTLVCNLGSMREGTAAVLQTAIVVDGPTGSNVVATGSFNGLTVPLPEIPIQNGFGMDMRWETASSAQASATPGNSQYFDFEWTLFLENGSDDGPDQVTYDLTITSPQGQPLELGQREPAAPYNQPCTPFTTGVAAGHPYTVGVGAANQQAPFVDQCLLTQTGPTTFRMTLTGIDYSRAQAPTRDSAGQPLPVDRTAVATGSIWLKAGPLAQNISVTLDSDEPVYTATTGLTDQDDAANNVSSRAVVLPGTWSHSYGRPRGGSPWDNSYTEPAGATIISSSNITIGAQNPPPGTTMGLCVPLDTQFVTYDHVALYGTNSSGSAYLPGYGTYAYYVGNDPLMTPGSGSYNPDAFTDCGGSVGWTNVEPADKSLVKGVRWTAPADGADSRNIFMQTFTTINPTTSIGQDVWTFGSYMINGFWDYSPHDTSPAGSSVFDITPTPGSRYPYTTGGRDKVRVIGAYPAVQKTVDRGVVRPGESVSYTLTYSANGSGVAATVDDYTIVDHLPIGMTYTAGSANPEPTITTDAGDGHQVLTWNLDGVTTNVQHPLTYQAVPGGSVTPGQALTNVVTASLGTETSGPASAQVTVETNGFTQISKTTDTPFIPNLDGSGKGEGSWTVTVRSVDPLPQAYTDVIDILPYKGDRRGTDFAGSYALAQVEVLDGQTVYYTAADPATLSDDPNAAANGGANTPSALWSTTKPAKPTAVRVIGPALAPGATQQFRVHIATDGAKGGNRYVNRAQGRAEHTRLVMRTSAPMSVAAFYSANLKKFVQDAQGVWRDANDVADYPAFKLGDTVNYRIVITNTGQGTLRNLNIKDDKFSQGSFHVDTLAPGQSQSHEFSSVIPGDATGTLVNTACATADTPADAAPVKPTINCDPAGREITNYVTRKDSDPLPGTPL
ncbi:DUF7507 domain-containing protein, partial [Nocardioides sp. LHG3406-4]|uniref:DUF7507 domain-containing protein n=1 Tax=Nocardioides sp. LHG3406-4 TaxID=2804575 RepID=UPI003CF70E34